MAEEQEADDEIGGGVGQENERRGGHGARRLAADHQVVEGVHRPEGRKGTCHRVDTTLCSARKLDLAGSGEVRI